jgi:hypothetical protein
MDDEQYKAKLSDYMSRQETARRDQPKPPMDDHYASLIENYLFWKKGYENYPDADATDNYTDALDRLSSYERRYARIQKVTGFIKHGFHRITFNLFN